MNSVVFSNNAETYIVENVFMDATTITVAGGGMSSFPKLEDGDYFYARIIHADDANITEYIKVYDISGNVLTVVRGVDNTQPRDFPVNSRVRHVLSASGLYDAQSQARIVREHASVTSEFGSGTGQMFGHVKLTDDFEHGGHSLYGVACTPKALREAVRRLTALPKEQFFTSSTTWKCPETGTYTITCVGGGGSGNRGGYAARDSCSKYYWGSETVETGYSCAYASGGGGGGGGAGQTMIKSIQCTKGTVYSITVGGPAGASAFGSSLVVGLAGSPGNVGGNGTAYAGGPGGWDGCSGAYSTGGGGGAGGTNYGIAANLSGGSGAGGVSGGGGGGAGGVSTFAPYGNGGRGGNGAPTNMVSSGSCAYWNIGSPSGGSAGTQGCIKIVYPLGK